MAYLADQPSIDLVSQRGWVRRAKIIPWRVRSHHPWLLGQLHKLNSNWDIDPNQVEKTVLINLNADQLLLRSAPPKVYPSIKTSDISSNLSTGQPFPSKKLRKIGLRSTMTRIDKKTIVSSTLSPIGVMDKIYKSQTQTTTTSLSVQYLI